MRMGNRLVLAASLLAALHTAYGEPRLLAQANRETPIPSDRAPATAEDKEFERQWTLVKRTAPLVAQYVMEAKRDAIRSNAMTLGYVCPCQRCEGDPVLNDLGFQLVRQ